MSNKKFGINKDAKPNSGISYVNGTFAVERNREDSDVSHRLGYSLTLTASSKSEDPGYRVTADIDYGDHVVQYDVDSYKPLTFDYENDTVEFTTYEDRYKIRALKDSDKSWLQNIEAIMAVKES